MASSLPTTAMGITGTGTSEDELWEIGTREGLSIHLRDLADAALRFALGIALRLVQDEQVNDA